MNDEAESMLEVLQRGANHNKVVGIKRPRQDMNNHEDQSNGQHATVGPHVPETFPMQFLPSAGKGKEGKAHKYISYCTSGILATEHKQVAIPEILSAGIALQLQYIQKGTTSMVLQAN
jgi:hypothetical protein